MIDLTEAKGLSRDLIDMTKELNQRIAAAYDRGMFINIAITERESVIGPTKGHCPHLNIGVACDPQEIAG